MILVCSICGASHYTQNCPEYAKGDHVKDKPSLNLSRSSVPNGLLIMDTQQGSCVVTSQKFAKGTRFGPLLAQKSYVPIKHIPFPLVLFAGSYYHHPQDEYCSELQALFGSSRNVYLDTRNETKCNWMIHVSLARFSNEQNLICYQEDDEIYYTAVKDIELGDILRVWYSRNYATKIGASLLEPSPYDICNNILRSVSMDYGGPGGTEMMDIDSNNNSSNFCPGATGVKGGTATPATATLATYDKVSLPPIDSLMKTSSPKYASSSSQPHMFDIDLLGASVPSATHHPTNVPDLVDEYFNSPSFVYSSHLGLHHQGQQAEQHAHGQFQSFHHPHQQQHGGIMSPPQQDTGSQELRLGRELYSSDQGHSVQSHPHHLNHHHQVQQHPIAATSTLADYQCLPDDTLSPADLINISLGASDINIAFDSAFSDAGEVAELIGTGGTHHHLQSYEGTDDGAEGTGFGDGTAFDLMATTSSTGSGAEACGVVGLEKLHCRFSSSSDSLITLNDANLAMTALTPTPSVVSSVPGTEVDVDKKYVCEVCLRKYMTKSNLDKHVRKHNLFLCVFCMKLFQQADELKEHECTERKSKTAYLHCPKCLKVLSNSWSLQRHMKIHKDLTPEEAAPLGATGGTADEVGKMGTENGEGTSSGNAAKDPTPYEDLSNSTPLVELRQNIDASEEGKTMTLVASGSEGAPDNRNAEFPIQREQHLLTEDEIKKEHPPVKTMNTTSSPTSPPDAPAGVSGASNLNSMQITNTSSSQDMLTNVQAPNGKQLYKCIVCSKLFKNPNALEKHLRKVHTVYTISNDYKTEKKVLSQLNQKKTPEAVYAHNSKEIGGGSHNLAAIANGGSGTGANPAKSHSIIIISNLELTNNNLIDTSQLFLNQAATHHGGNVGTNGMSGLGSKIDVKVLNATDKLPKLVPISNHHRHHPQQQQQQQLHHQHPVAPGQQGGPTTLQLSGTKMLVPPAATASGHNTASANAMTGMHEHPGAYQLATASLLRGKADDGDTDAYPGATRDTVALVPSSPLFGSDSQTLTLSPMKLTSAEPGASVLDDVYMDDKRHLIEASTSVVSHDELSNYQLKRHMEIHDSVYYNCPYCDRLPLKAKASLRKHLYNAHPERAPPKEQINKFISTLVVTDENMLRELAQKNMRKIRNKSAKMQAKQAQQQLQLQHQEQQQEQQQRTQHHPPQQRQTMAASVETELPGESFPAPSPGAGANSATTGIILYENGLSDSMLDEQGEDMLSFKTIFPAEDGSIGESSMDQMDHVALENCDQSSTCSSNTTHHGSVVGGEDKKRKAGPEHREHKVQQQRRQSETHSPIAGGSHGKGSGHSIDDGVIVGEGKRMKVLNASSGSGSGSGMSRLNSTVTSGSVMLDVCGNDTSEHVLVNSRYPANRATAGSTSSSNGTGTALRYLRKNQYPGAIMTPTLASVSMEPLAPSSSSSSMSLMPHNGHLQHNPHHQHHHHGAGPNSALDGSGQLNLDSLFGNISIDNYEFDDNATIQSFSLIEEKFKTSFDQIQEKLDAELPFDEEQIKWQNNLMANDSSSEIGDKLLTGEENIMLI
uniref:Uncharacterized protein n=1 Tax=Anopheles atroparvus TaxID=41427 RepID=A0A182JAX8_ANOAO